MEGLRAHLRVLEIQHVSIWYAQPTLPGTEWDRKRDDQLQSAHLILFLISSGFLNSEQYEKTVFPSMERYKRGEVCVVPIILRPVHWQETPFGQLEPLPEHGRPVTDLDYWKSLDHAFFDVVCGLKLVLDEIKLSLPASQKNNEAFPTQIEGSAQSNSDGARALERILQDFKVLRQHIASAVFLNAPQGFSVESCENQYHRLYGNTMVFLAMYLPQVISPDEDGFVETVYRKAATTLQQRSDLFVWITRRIITPLAGLEKLAAQIDACVATLEFYKRKDFL